MSGYNHNAWLATFLTWTQEGPESWGQSMKFPSDCVFLRTCICSQVTLYSLSKGGILKMQCTRCNTQCKNKEMVKNWTWAIDADPGLWGPYVMAAMDKFTWTTEVLWRKGMAWLLSKSERRLWPLPPTQAFIAFLGILHEDGPHLLCTGSL